jgi:hypothetical protein
MKTPELNFLTTNLRAKINHNKNATQKDIDLLWEVLTIKLLLKKELGNPKK